MVTVEEAIEVLNRIHVTDPTVLPRLIDHRVPCNEALANDPTVQVGDTDDGPEVGLLGILNGIFGIQENGTGYIAAVCTKYGGELIGFRVNDGSKSSLIWISGLTMTKNEMREALGLPKVDEDNA